MIFEAGPGEGRYWRYLWDYRELFAVLAWRDVAVRCKQAAVGLGFPRYGAESKLMGVTGAVGHTNSLT